jgi:signal transduction histidine kinase
MGIMCIYDITERRKTFALIKKGQVVRNYKAKMVQGDKTRYIKINKKNVDIVYLTRCIIKSVNTYVADKNVTVTFISSINKKIIGIDDEKYERILLNLISNAIKFSIKNKVVIVKLRNKRGKICIVVIDKGIGIPENKRDLIFERFGQVDSSLSRYAEGAGIGLSLVKRLVIALGGSISVKSIEGKGSTFTVMIPDEKILTDSTDKPMVELLDNRLVEITNIEFSDVYL